MSGGTFALIGMMIAMFIRSGKEFGKIENKKINYTHIALLLFTVLMTSLSLNGLIAIILDFDTMFKNINIEVAFLSPLMNAILWGIYTILNVIVLIAAFSVVRREERGRKVLVALTPLLFLLGTIISSSKIMASVPDGSIAISIVIATILLAISYLPIYFFYANKNVKSVIFNTQKLTSS